MCIRDSDDDDDGGGGGGDDDDDDDDVRDTLFQLLKLGGVAGVLSVF